MPNTTAITRLDTVIKLLDLSNGHYSEEGVRTYQRLLALRDKWKNRTLDNAFPQSDDLKNRLIASGTTDLSGLISVLDKFEENAWDSNKLQAWSESFCMEVIYAMKNPTINEFANFIQISSPNAAYKVNSLIRKGYLKKIQSRRDKREYYLKVTQKYLDYYNVSSSYVSDVLAKVKESMTDEEWHDFHHVLGIINREQMRDVPTYKADRAQEIREIEADEAKQQ